MLPRLRRIILGTIALIGEERARRVYLERRAPILERERVQRSQHDAADRMHQPVDLTDLLLNRLDDCRECLRIENVTGKRGCADVGRNGLKPGRIPRHQGHAMARGQQPASRLGTDAARTAGDHNRLAHPGIRRRDRLS